MTYREQSTNKERTLVEGDEELNWRTYSDLWRDLQLTRGALDVLVFNGKVPWVSGEQLHEFMAKSTHPAIEAAARLGARVTINKNTIYYLVDEFLLALRVGESVARLTGDDNANDMTKLYKATIPLLQGVRLFEGDEHTKEELELAKRRRR